MTHAEKRQAVHAAQCAAGDPRALLLAATAPADRSEVAARYDRAREAAELERPTDPTQGELDQLGMELWRASVAIALTEHASSSQIVPRYLGGHRTSAGMDRDIVRAEAETPFPGRQEIITAWHERRRLRREYIRQRYGV